MGLQLIFCVETNRKADTDWVYIGETIKAKYKVSNQIKLSKINMETKSKYNSRRVLADIEQQTKWYKNYARGETKVIYCIDTDAYESNYEHKKELDEIKSFCEKNGYELVWFCHDIEEVFLGKKVESSQKVKEAGAFRSNRGIERVQEEKLSAVELRNKCSNLMRVLDKHLERKYEKHS